MPPYVRSHKTWKRFILNYERVLLLDKEKLWIRFTLLTVLNTILGL